MLPRDLCRLASKSITDYSLNELTSLLDSILKILNVNSPLSADDCYSLSRRLTEIDHNVDSDKIANLRLMALVRMIVFAIRKADRVKHPNDTVRDSVERHLGTILDDRGECWGDVPFSVGGWADHASSELSPDEFYEILRLNFDALTQHASKLTSKRVQQLKSHGSFTDVDSRLDSIALKVSGLQPPTVNELAIQVAWNTESRAELEKLYPRLPGTGKPLIQVDGLCVWVGDTKTEVPQVVADYFTQLIQEAVGQDVQIRADKPRAKDKMPDHLKELLIIKGGTPDRLNMSKVRVA